MGKNTDLTLKSNLGQIYSNPIGHDIFDKLFLQMNIKSSIMKNPFVSNLKLKTISKLAKNQFSPEFFDAFLTLCNSEKENVESESKSVSKKWWKEAVFYQIYPRTFCDTNGDGIGDLQGIISKLDYLKDLGINALWLSPIYDSPMDDNGYDIRDYKKISELFGSMKDFDVLLEEVHKRDMKLIMDLVINHTSDEHEWFKKALDDKKSKYHDYYLFKDKPNNWDSFFGEKAWNYYEKNNEYALHLFSKKQMDLNWENPELRADVISMINWWLDKGVDGFRMDVINYISKVHGLPEGDESIGKTMGFTGIEHYFYGPHLHDYLREIQEKAFTPHSAFSVGECPGLGLKMANLVTNENRKELDMIFSFDHLENPGKTRYDDYKYDLTYYRDYISESIKQYGNSCWMSLFYNNHDNPKMVSKIGGDKKYTRQIQKLLAVMQFTLKGTPFVFQGDEMGITNYKFKSIDEITDVEAKGFYKQYLETMSEKEALNKIICGTREHSRELIPWEDAENLSEIAKQQKPNKDIYSVYKKLIEIRKINLALIYGDFEVLNNKGKHFTYSRKIESTNQNFVIDCNLGDKNLKTKSFGKNATLVYPSKIENSNVLQPYEARIWKI